MSDVLTVKDLVVEYVSEGYRVRPLDGFTLTAARGELTVLLGPSGSGKTTLLSCLGGILTPTAGSIRLGETEITELGAEALERYRRQEVGFVFQAFNLIPSLTAQENVAIPLIMSGVSRKAALARAADTLATVGLADRRHHKPRGLSGGQQQRVAVARGIVHEPALLLADEPTANLDYVQAEAIIRLLRDLRDQGRIIVISTHDARLVPVADKTVQMAQDVETVHGAPQAVSYAAGETIFEQGDPPRLAYVVESGEVEVFRRLADGGETVLTALGPGKYFGELGALMGTPRAASVRATTDCTFTAYGPHEFRQEVLGH
ncbi:MAG TPA: ATP-binding cassette domain-containing protein [Acidimicrobiia bacterium]|nr:ATP-binding cassette domain-containing protein [Acidimicrobiia bacterium]